MLKQYASSNQFSIIDINESISECQFLVETTSNSPFSCLSCGTIATYANKVRSTC